MPEISNSVRQRLGARPAPATHPDADVLTAYVEQVLPAGERNQIVEHLAACAFCRDIVALSLPELPEKTLVQSLPAPSRFWTLGLRWAGGLAVIAIAVTLVIERPRHNGPAQSPASTVAVTAQTEPANLAKSSSSSNEQKAAGPAPAESTTPDASRTRSALPLVSSSDLSPRADRASAPLAAPPPALKESRNEVIVVDGKDAGRFASNAVGGLVASNNPPRPIPAQPNKGFVNNNIFSAEEHFGPSNYTNSYNYARQEQARADGERLKKEQSELAFAPQNSELDANARKGFLRTAIPKLNPARLAPLAANALTAVKSATTGSPAPSEALAGGASSFATAPAHPAISPKSLAKSASSTTREPMATSKPDARKAKTSSSEPLHWRVQDGKLVNSADQSQWHEAYPQGDDIQFKVVQSQGHDVWAGGTNGTLVHSWDGGVDWQKLNLGDAASGDIEKISLSGGDVQVKTSNGQHLISRDGGKTWAPLNPQSTPAQPNQPK